MADQEFLASFGVEIDESGVERLQTALEENRILAEELAAAFDDARASVQAFFASLGEISLPGMNAGEARSAEESSGMCSIFFIAKVIQLAPIHIVPHMPDCDCQDDQ